MLYPSRQNLRDHNGNSWQTIALKRIHPGGSAIVSTVWSLPSECFSRHTLNLRKVSPEKPSQRQF
ncbi:DUF3122 domain-containing protein [Microcoleus vaginatus]|uniref:DUF3122 domain-containing protein n=1 Tax=Microcoleus vaginatus TaxID=119532 RepID=UPI001F60EBF8|nr:DUF3122 domain-containing protein [Microcoleus vaginatus HSN003]